jgi:hypothetical protein
MDLPEPVGVWPQNLLAQWRRLIVMPVDTQRGHFLVVAGKTFICNQGARRRKRKPGNRVNWTCSVKKCKATAASDRAHPEAENTNIELKNPHSTVASCGFNCPQKWNVVHIQARALILDMCKNQNYLFTAAVEEVIVLLDFYDQNISLTFSTGSLDQTVKTNNRASRLIVPGPDSVEHLEIPIEFSRTIGEREQFLLLNGRIENPDGTMGRIVIYGTEEYLYNLLSWARVFADGTFDMAPSPFLQMFTIHAFFDNILLPFLYVFLTHKTKDIYKILFEWIKQWALDHERAILWKSITTDFESGLLPAIFESFPGLQINGCHFHFTQAIIRYLYSECGLKTDYDENINYIQSYVNRIFTLAFLPVDEVQDKWVSDTMRKPEYDTTTVSGVLKTGQVAKFEQYITDNWMTNGRFPPHLWNVFAINDNHRTNNNGEAWNKRIGTKCKANNSNRQFFEVVKVITKEQASTDVKKRKLAEHYPIWNQNIDKDQLAKYARINALRGRYLNDEVSRLVYFEGIYKINYRKGETPCPDPAEEVVQMALEAGMI